MEYDFFPSTLEHRPLHAPEKVELKKYFAATGEDEYEGYTPSLHATAQELADFEAWVWGLRFWGRECLVRGTAGALGVLMVAWEAALAAGETDPVPVAVAYGQVLSPAEAISLAHYWAEIPSEEKALRIIEMEKPLPVEWFSPPLYVALQSKPFFWGALAAWRLVQAILAKRDPAAVGLAQACSAAARTRMLAGRSPGDAVADVKGRMVLTLREWMGHKW